jgi:hypothetical protein
MSKRLYVGNLPAELDGRDFEGRPLRVSIAQDRRSGGSDHGPRRSR